MDLTRKVDGTDLCAKPRLWRTIRSSSAIGAIGVGERKLLRRDQAHTMNRNSGSTLLLWHSSRTYEVDNSPAPVDLVHLILLFHKCTDRSR